MGDGGEGAGARHKVTDQVRDLLRFLSEPEGAGGEPFTRGFLLRSADGSLEVAPAAGSRLGPGLSRLARTASVAPIEDAGGSYAVVASPAEGAWLVYVQGDRLAAAFEYADAADALAAVPERLRAHTNLDLVRAAVWAYIRMDVSKLLALLADEFTYTDLHYGWTLEGATTAVNRLMLLAGELPSDAGLQGLRFRELAGDIVEASGMLDRVVEGSETTRWRWTVVSGIEGGEIAWSVRRPDRALEAEGPGSS